MGSNCPWPEDAHFRQDRPWGRGWNRTSMQWELRARRDVRGNRGGKWALYSAAVGDVASSVYKRSWALLATWLALLYSRIWTSKLLLLVQLRCSLWTSRKVKIFPHTMCFYINSDQQSRPWVIPPLCKTNISWPKSAWVTWFTLFRNTRRRPPHHLSSGPASRLWCWFCWSTPAYLLLYGPKESCHRDLVVYLCSEISSSCQDCNGFASVNGRRSSVRVRWPNTLKFKTKRVSGPIFSLNLAGQPVVVLNNHKVTADLLGEHIQDWPLGNNWSVGFQIVVQIFTAIAHGSSWPARYCAKASSWRMQAMVSCTP